MKSLLIGLCLAVLPFVAPAPGALAQDADGDLVRLDTMALGREWEAVGRLDIDGSGFCTGAMIADDLVLTAAHCLFDKFTGARVDHTQIVFRAGLRNGRASASRRVRHAAVHPDYRFSGAVSPQRVRIDVALLQLDQPIRNGSITPFATDQVPFTGDRVGVVSYARERSEAPSLQEICGVMGEQEDVLVMSCDVDFGASGSPVFTFGEGRAPRIVSVISAKAEVDGRRVALGAPLDGPLPALRAALSAGGGHVDGVTRFGARVQVGGGRDTSSAKFVRPGG